MILSQRQVTLAEAKTFDTYMHVCVNQEKKLIDDMFWEEMNLGGMMFYQCWM